MKFPLDKIACGIAGVVVGFAGYGFVHTLGAGPVWAKAATPPAMLITVKKAPQETIDAVYPLFNSGIWSPKVSVSLPPRSIYNPTDLTIAGYQVTSLPTASTEDIGGTVEPIRNYYNEHLLKDGWHIDINSHADGPGGSVWGFRKGKEILILSYTSTFFNTQPNSPLQCPCTIVFTIIGGTLE